VMQVVDHASYPLQLAAARAVRPARRDARRRRADRRFRPRRSSTSSTAPSAASWPSSGWPTCTACWVGPHGPARLLAPAPSLCAASSAASPPLPLPHEPAPRPRPRLLHPARRSLRILRRMLADRAETRQLVHRRRPPRPTASRWSACR
jgi:hypothetical protein